MPTLDPNTYHGTVIYTPYEMIYFNIRIDVMKFRLTKNVLLVS